MVFDHGQQVGSQRGDKIFAIHRFSGLWHSVEEKPELETSKMLGIENGQIVEWC
jgi:hypothetical protein